MTYTEQGDRVTMEMTRSDYNMLLLVIGTALGAAMKIGDEDWAKSMFRFVNEMNRTNPNFVQYQEEPRG